MEGLTEILMAGFNHIPDTAKRRAFAAALAFGLADAYALRQLWED